MTSLTIAYVGMTHLGLISAVGAAEKGFNVVCFDPDKHQIELLKAKKLSIVEPSLPQLLEKNLERLHFTCNPIDLNLCDLVYIAPDVPTNELGQSDFTKIHELIDLVSNFLNKESFLIILSQVSPGFTRKLVWPKSQLFYQVETLIFGQAIERTLNPERFILGASEPSRPVPIKLSIFLQAFDCPIFPMRYESAELSKIAINMFLVSSITTTNTIAELCEKIGANWSEILPSLQLDKRIGKHAYLAPGLGIAGGNLERDMATFCSLADLHGTDAGVVRAWKYNANHRCDWVLEKIHECILPRKKCPIFAILGLSYKKNTASIKNSPSLALISCLRDFTIQAFDPAVKSLPDCYSAIQSVNSSVEAYQGADVLIIMTPWDEFRNLSPHDLAKALNEKTVIDPYGVMDESTCISAGLNYHRLGV
ncbi:MAG: nucleotide sugar dehydrogenase [Simkania sp.]|nr:nucleotide sugar dehydrogenase [Simkania sp.]